VKQDIKDPIEEVQSQEKQEEKDVIASGMDQFLTFDDLAGEKIDLDISGLIEKQQHPFFGYQSRKIRQRVYPRDTNLDFMSLEQLVEYCRERKWIHDKYMTPIYNNATRDIEKFVLKMKTIQGGKEKPVVTPADLLAFIEEKETATFDTVFVMFCGYRRKKSVPYSRSVFSYEQKRMTDMVFDKIWPGKKGAYAIIPDHTTRAQLLFRFNPRAKGKLIPDKRFSFLEQDMKQIPLLKQVFLLCQKNKQQVLGSMIASSGAKAEAELFGSELPGYQDFD